MTTTQRSTVVGVFKDRAHAQAAVRMLKEKGFTDSQIGFIAPGGDEMAIDQATGSRVGEGSVMGALAGAGVGALWAIGIVSAVVPAIGPAVAGGILMSLIASAGGAAAVGTLIGGLVGLGVPDKEAEFYENEFKSGRTLVTVKAENRVAEAWSILQQNGATTHSDVSTGGAAVKHTATEHVATAHAATASVATAHAATAATVHTGTAGQTVKLHEEHLHASKTPVTTGEVRVHKEVTTHQQTITVPVTREEVVIERHAVSGHASTSDIRTGEEIRIPVSEEKVHVTKEAVQTEEVTVGKRKVTENQEVAGTVRKETIKVEREGEVDVHNKPKK